jgi:hypothetical protein
MGDLIGEYTEMDGVEEGMVVGKFPQVKVRMDIHKPIMSGTLVEMDEKGRTFW